MSDARQTALRGERAAEQAHLDLVYSRLDSIVAAAERELATIRRAGSTGTHQARSERDSFATTLERRIAQLRSVQDRLCFGRLDLRTGERHHIGRIGLSDEHQDKLLIDWRAPVAAPFYQATPASPGEVVRRRHLTTSGREVVRVDDEVLDLAELGDDDRATLQGEGALMVAVKAPRTGRMGDIVATIQGEQDRIVRDELAGALVVQGGPGTGKTAVALHRAAYLLFTYRQRLERAGVLVVGPGPLFLRYIEQVLPSLGESGVVMATPGTLFPGVVASAHEADDVARLKGDLRMVEVIAKAVRDRQRLPDSDLELQVGQRTLVLTRAAVAASRARARTSGAPHNVARVRFVKDVLRHLAALLATQLGHELTDELRQELDVELRESRDVRVNLNLLWMPLTPERLLRDLFAVPVRLESAAPQLRAGERELLQRDRAAPWSVHDVPLLDELAELIGDDDEDARAQERARAAQRATDLDYARGVLSMQGMRGPGITAELLADQFAEQGPFLSVAERAEGDRSWVFGHLIVDEAQELTSMMWRLLARRVPGRSWTVVGDLAQRAAAAGTSSWAEALDAVAPGRWRERSLSVSYRTPSQVLAVADAMARANGLPVTPVTSVREGEFAPAVQPRAAGDVGAVERVVARLLASSDEGTIAVVVPTDEQQAVAERLQDAWPGQVGLAQSSALSTRISVLVPEDAKGLEFDDVVVLEPAAVVRASSRGLSDLYVALSRPTRRLVVVHHEPLPAGMTGLQPWPAAA